MNKIAQYPIKIVQPGSINRIEEMLAEMTRAGSFTGSVLIAQDGKVLLSKGFGLSNRVERIRNTPQTHFRLASITKQFTAMAVLILQSQGKLSVEDLIRNHIAGCPALWRDITIHHLLTHTSGLSSQLWPILMESAKRTEHNSQPVPLFSFFPDLPLDFHPGEQFSYNNPGYILLTYIIEQVSGQSYADFLEKVIFIPLRMHDSGYEDSSSELAKGYMDSNARIDEPLMLLPFSNGAGQLFSSVEDLFLWDQVLYTDQLLPRNELEWMFEPYVHESNVPGFGYGYGWYVGNDQGKAVVAHSGDGNGFTSLIVRYHADRLTGLLLINQQDIRPIPIWATIYSVLLGKE